MVADTGVGIAEAHGDHVFDAFYQVPMDADGDSGRGFGLGLAIVKQLAGLLGHGLDMRSRPGRGTSFTLLLPVCTDGEVSA